MVIKISITNNIKVQDLPEDIARKVAGELTILNPAFQDAEKYGRWTGKIDRYLKYYNFDDGTMIMPRGYLYHLAGLLDRYDIKYKIKDGTRKLPSVPFTFRGSLRDYQIQAMADVLEVQEGVLEMPPGAGKTTVALRIIAERQQPALVIVHTKELLYQWRARACQFLDMTEGEVGLIGDGHRRIGKRLTVALINSLYKAIDEVRPAVGHLVVDECHHTPARTFVDAVGLFDSTYMLGLSATPYRRDRLTKVIYLYMGDRVHQVLPQDLQAQNHIMTARLIVRETGFDYPDPAGDYQGCIQAMVEDPDRNKLIVSDVIDEVRTRRGGIALVLSDRVSHCEELFRSISALGVKACMLTGSVPVKERARLVDELNGNQAQVLVATVQLIGEGFDLKQLSSIFLATPIKFSGRVKQSVGRVLRTHEGKEEALIYDYLDLPGVLRASFRSRCRTYAELGCERQEDDAPSRIAI